MDGGSSRDGRLFVVVDVSQLVAFGFVQLLDGDVVELCEECSSLLNLLILICFGEVYVLSFEWQVSRRLRCVEVSNLKSLVRVKILAVELVLRRSNLLRSLALLVIDWHCLLRLLVLLVLLIVVWLGVILDISSHSSSLGKRKLFLWRLLLL